MKSLILTADSVAGLSSLSDDSVDLIVTSPPYDDLRTYGGFDQWDFPGTALQIKRVLKQGGVCCWNVNNSTKRGSETCTCEKQKIYFVEELKLNCHDTMIWHKTNFNNPESVRYHNVFEYVYVFSKGTPKTWHPIMDKVNSTAGRIGTYGRNTYTKRDGHKAERQRQITKKHGKRGNVWYGKTRGQEDMCKKLPRTAMMPRWLARDLIISWSNPGDMVVDPFAGSGTTGVEALRLGRSVVMIDLDPAAYKVIEGYLACAQKDLI